ncbi:MULTISPECIES: DMT family transporter [Clostridium]|uniref:EamA-like transporter family protein n=1 Tax=Clostridium cadaveris TaxID=1529 RepID=A0A1I2MD82_9CLOT|nr:DMT family transporter [Clostridium cadaveris]MDU4951198.1 DMT family transporter [Clostridium sp.]MDM8313084.1 DMT family transporter [Clostridium cadaveris]MDY4950586.1 DMT family transporter [Clostridium cadaveris]NME66270.1 DMT family transporter [Clostridium cadaveris]NWK10136.1 DMT family transporter [Clostridium cadaveris]
MIGIIFSIIAGAAMSFQGVFNTRLEEKIGTWETNVLVQGIAFLLTLIIVLFFGKGDFKELASANKLYLLGGVLGAVITFTVMKGIGDLGPTYAISTILVSQLLTAGIIDAFGLFDSQKLSFGFSKVIGIAIMIVGIIIFKWKS